MRKFYLFMLMAVGLLISGNVGAVNQQNGHNPKQEGDVAEMTVTNTEMGTTKVTYYADLQTAFDDLPTNSYPATITVLKNIEAPVVLSATQAWTVPAKCNLTLDLNGKSVYTSTNNDNKSSALIKNNGTLTIKDGVGGGYLTNTSTSPDVEWQDREKYKYPTYANDVILNSGTVIVESGTIENGTSGDVGATYCIENSYDANSTIIINGGKLISHSTAVRFFGGKESNFTMNGGIIEADRMGFQINGAPGKHKVNLNDGVIISKKYGAVDLWVETATYAQNITEANINGGTYYGSGSNGLYMDKLASSINFNITGGVFMWETGSSFIGNEDGTMPINKTISGGVFKKTMITSEAGLKLIKPGYGPRELTEEEKASVVVRDENGNKIENFDFSNFQIVVPLETKTTTQSGNWTEAFGGSVPGEMDVVVVGHNVTVSEGTNANAYTVKTGDQEAQIVVKNGAILNVGNGGIVSENDDLVFVKVEAGGKLTIGHGGLDQEGEMYPIIIENDGNNSGTYMVSPDATNTEVTEPEATVRVFTNAYMKQGVNHWQQMACPVNNPQYMNIYKLGEQTEDIPTISTEIYKWDYAEDAWSKLHTFTGNWSSPALETFKAYDLINNSLPTEGGVTYEFKGNLVGNKDMKLTFPEHGYCIFGNSYTAPIDLTVLFEQISNDITTENIDPCVYIFNSKNDRFEEVNALGLYLKSIGIGEVAFTQIPSQQAFIMNLIGGSSAETAVDYRNAVWGNTQTTAAPLRAPKNIDVNTVANIVVADANRQDHVMVVESSQYDAQYNRGADAEKYMDANHFNLYATTEAGKLAMVATDNLEGTTLTFQAGQEVEYTMTFVNVLNNDYSLLDLLTNEVISITEGNSYTFAAQPNSTEARFQIVSSAKAPTGVENTKVVAAKGIYSVMGQYLGETTNWNNMPNGVYVIDGVKVVK